MILFLNLFSNKKIEYTFVHFISDTSLGLFVTIFAMKVINQISEPLFLVGTYFALQFKSTGVKTEKSNLAKFQLSVPEDNGTKCFQN